MLGNNKKSIGFNSNYFNASGSNIIDPQALIFYDRVIADGGVVPTGLVGVSATFKAIKLIYGVTDITTAISVFYDAHYLGYKKGTGTGTTLGQACTKLYSACGASGDCVQATLASQPLLLAHNGVDNYWFGSGISGNHVATASQSALKFNTDFSVVINLESYLASTAMELAGSSGGWAAFSIGFSGLLAFDFGGVRFTSTSAISGATNWIRYSASGTSLFFYISTDGVTWTQLGTTVTMSARATPTNIEIWVGRGNGNIANPLNGKIKSIKYYTDSALATIIYNFNPATYNASTSQTQWTSTTGEVWTINTGTATTGYKGVLVDRTIIQSDGIDDNLTDASFASTQAYSEYIAHRRFGTGNLVSKATGNSLSNNATNFILNNGVVLNFANTSLLRQLITTRNNGASSGQAINNGTETTGNAGTNNGTTLVIGGGNFGVNTYIQSILNDGSTVRTAMYNFIKTLNNNAF